MFLLKTLLYQYLLPRHQYHALHMGWGEDIILIRNNRGICEIVPPLKSTYHYTIYLFYYTICPITPISLKILLTSLSSFSVLKVLIIVYLLALYVSFISQLLFLFLSIIYL